MTASNHDDKLMNATASVVAGYLARNDCDPARIPQIVSEIGHALARVRDLDQGVAAFSGEGGDEAVASASHAARAPAPAVSTAPQAGLTPAVPIEESIQGDYIVCLEDGKKLKMLKRHLRAKYNLSPEQYRERWGLPSDYPMVAPNYSEQRRRIAEEGGIPQMQASQGATVNG